MSIAQLVQRSQCSVGMIEVKAQMRQLLFLF